VLHVYTMVTCLYSVVITLQSNILISQFSSLDKCSHTVSKHIAVTKYPIYILTIVYHLELVACFVGFEVFVRHTFIYLS